MKKISKLDFFCFQNYKQLHAVRVALSFIITFLLLRIINIPNHSWPLISLVVVLAPISFVGNVYSRASHRIIGTIIGATLGIASLYLESQNIVLMIPLLLLVLFTVGYMALGKYPYVAILIGITMSVVCSSPVGSFDAALWRSIDIVIGCILAVIFTLIFPQKAFVHWRIRNSLLLNQVKQRFAHTISSNVLEKNKSSQKFHEDLSANMDKLKSLSEPAAKEMKSPKSNFLSLSSAYNELIINAKFIQDAYWRDERSHVELQISASIRELNKKLIDYLTALADYPLHLDDSKIANLKISVERAVAQFVEEGATQERSNLYLNSSLFLLTNFAVTLMDLHTTMAAILQKR